MLVSIIARMHYMTFLIYLKELYSKILHVVNIDLFRNILSFQEFSFTEILNGYIWKNMKEWNA